MRPAKPPTPLNFQYEQDGYRTPKTLYSPKGSPPPSTLPVSYPVDSFPAPKHVIQAPHKETLPEGLKIEREEQKLGYPERERSQRDYNQDRAHKISRSKEVFQVDEELNMHLLHRSTEQSSVASALRVARPDAPSPLESLNSTLNGEFYNLLVESKEQNQAQQYLNSTPNEIEPMIFHSYQQQKLTKIPISELQNRPRHSPRSYMAQLRGSMVIPGPGPQNCGFCSFTDKKSMKSVITENLNAKYLTPRDIYNVKIVNDIIYNECTHLVSVFKDFLIFDDISEYLKRFYPAAKSQDRLPRIFDFYDSYSTVFPNFINLPEGKYMLKNIHKKQRAIDEKNQQLLEQNQRQNRQQESNRLFTTRFIDSVNRIKKLGMTSSLTAAKRAEESLMKKPLHQIPFDQLLQLFLKRDSFMYDTQGVQKSKEVITAPKPKISGYAGQKRNKLHSNEKGMDGKLKRRSSGKLEDIVAQNRVSPSTLTNLNRKYPSLGSYKAAQERQELERIQAKYPKMSQKRKSTTESTKRASLPGREGSRERSNQRNPDQRKLSKGQEGKGYYGADRLEHQVREKTGVRKQYSGSQEPKLSREAAMNVARAEVIQRYNVNIRGQEYQTPQLNEEQKHTLKYEKITGLRVPNATGGSYSEKFTKKEDKPLFMEQRTYDRSEKKLKCQKYEFTHSGRSAQTSAKRSGRLSSETNSYGKRELSGHQQNYYKARLIEPEAPEYRFKAGARKSEALPFQPQTSSHLESIRGEQQESSGNVARVPQFEAIFTSRQRQLKEAQQQFRANGKMQRSSGSVPSQGVYGQSKRSHQNTREYLTTQENRTTKTSLTKGDTISGEYSYRSLKDSQPEILKKRYKHNFNENYAQRSLKAQRVDSADPKVNYMERYHTQHTTRSSRQSSKGERTNSNSSTGSSLSKSGQNQKRGHQQSSSHYNGFQQRKRSTGYSGKHKFIPQKRPHYEPYYQRHPPEKKQKPLQNKKEVRKYLKPTETVDFAPRMSYSKSAQNIHSRGKAKYQEVQRAELNRQRVPQKIDEDEFLRTLEEKASMYLKQHNQRRAFLASQKGH